MTLKSFAKIATSNTDEQKIEIDENLTNDVDMDNDDSGVDTASRFEESNSEVIREMEEQYPEMTAEYKRIMNAGYETFCLKMSNYGVDNISLGSTLEREEDRKLSLIGLWFRVSDKIQRLKQMTVIGKRDNVGEAATETYQDLSIYSILAQLVTSGKWGK